MVMISVSTALGIAALLFLLMALLEIFEEPIRERLWRTKWWPRVAAKIRGDQ